MFFFLLAQYCVNLSRWFLHENAAFYTEQCMTPLLFYNFELSQDAYKHPLDNYGFVLDAIFFVCMHVLAILVIRMRIFASHQCADYVCASYMRVQVGHAWHVTFAVGEAVWCL